MPCMMWARTDLDREHRNVCSGVSLPLYIIFPACDEFRLEKGFPMLGWQCLSQILAYARKCPRPPSRVWSRGVVRVRLPRTGRALPIISSDVNKHDISRVVLECRRAGMTGG